jgi:hypothetical protein
MNLVTYSTFPVCSGDNLNWNNCMTSIVSAYKEQVKVFLRTNAQNQGQQGNVSSVIVEDETRIFGRNPRSASKVWSTAFEVVQT